MTVTPILKRSDSKAVREKLSSYLKPRFLNLMHMSDVVPRIVLSHKRLPVGDGTVTGWDAAVVSLLLVALCNFCSWWFWRVGWALMRTG